MNATRQKRLEAIARRRAFLDNQLLMLSRTELRVPNIIRNRNGRQLQSNLRASNVQRVELAESKLAQGSPQNHIVGNQSASPLSHTALSQSLGFHQSASGDEVYVTVISEGDGEGQMTFSIEGASAADHCEADGSLPITLSEDEITKMLSGASQQLSQPLETFKTDDGTVMVVLDGNNFTENEIEAGGNTTGTLTSEEETSEASTLVSAEPFPEGGSSNEEAETTSYEESYVIMQTIHGDVLVPSSKLNSQFQTQASSDDSIVQFIATESGAIEELMTTSSRTSDLVTTTKRKTAAAPRRINPNTARSKPLSRPCPPPSAIIGSAIKKPNIKNWTTVKKLTTNFPSAKITSPKSNSIKGTSNSAASESKVPVRTPYPVKEEKPRPFRFECPELEDNQSDLDDCFMSVPVPIKIDSLRSETNKNQITNIETLQTESANITVPESNTETESTVHLEGAENEQKEVSEQETLTQDSQTLTEESQSLTCQQCNKEFSSSENNSNQPDEICCCASIFQCAQCLVMFDSEASFSCHLDNCEPVSQDNSSIEVPPVTQREGESDLNPISNTHESAHSIENKEICNDATDEGNIMIKSCSSLYVPASASSPSSLNVEAENVEKQPETSSPEKFSSIVVAEQQLSEPVIIVSSRDFISNDENLMSFCVQIVDDDGSVNDLSAKRMKLGKSDMNSFVGYVVPKNEINNSNPDSPQYEVIASTDSNSNLLESQIESVLIKPKKELMQLEVNDKSRRTLNKASAKAKKLDNEIPEGEWELETAEGHVDKNGNSVTIQSARIRSRNDRIKAMDKNGTSEEDLEFNFRNIFEQVVKQNIP